MKKEILALSSFLSLCFLSSCTIAPVSYYPGYRNDFTYSVGYYGYRPYWGGRYNASYGIGPGRALYGGYHPLNRAGYSYIRRW